jgi:hypothetical protein
LVERISQIDSLLELDNMYRCRDALLEDFEGTLDVGRSTSTQFFSMLYISQHNCTFAEFQWKCENQRDEVHKNWTYWKAARVAGGELRKFVEDPDLGYPFLLLLPPYFDLNWAIKQTKSEANLLMAVLKHPGSRHAAPLRAFCQHMQPWFNTLFQANAVLPSSSGMSENIGRGLLLLASEQYFLYWPSKDEFRSEPGQRVYELAGKRALRLWVVLLRN